MLMIDSKAKFVSKDEIAQVPTPGPTESWHPVPHVEVIDAVTEVVHNHGRKMFGVMRINRSSSPEWTRCIGIRNSHDQSLAVGLTAGISVLVCSNLCFGGSMVLKRRHTSRIDLTGLVELAMTELETEFLTLETVAADLRNAAHRQSSESLSDQGGGGKRNPGVFNCTLPVPFLSWHGCSESNCFFRLYIASRE